MRNHFETKDILTAKAATGFGTPIKTTDFRHLVLMLDTADSTIATIKVYGSLQETPPTWASAQAQDNSYAPIAVIHLDDGATIPGSTGVVTAVDLHELYSINTDGVNWINVAVSDYTQGTIYVRAKGFNDNA